jgi:hypothetical protein
MFSCLVSEPRIRPQTYTELLLILVTVSLRNYILLKILSIIYSCERVISFHYEVLGTPKHM